MALSSTPLGDELSSALLDSLFGQAPVGLGLWDRELRYLRINRALAEIDGVPAEEHLGRRLDEVLPDLDPEVLEGYRGVLQTGIPLVDVEVSGETPAHPGERRTWRGSFFPVRQPASAEIIGVGAVLTEITEQRRADDAQQRLQEELARKTSVLEAVVDRVPVGISLVWGPEHRIDLINERAFGSVPDLAGAVGRPIREVYPQLEDEIASSYDAVRESGETLVREDYAVPFPDDPGSLDGRRYYTSTLVPVPGSSPADSGVLTVFWETTDEVRRRRELEHELAEEHRIAHTLQQSLLPERLPELPGLELASRFRPAGRRFEVGGDFYEVVPAAGSSWVLAVGDVCGKGAEAAALTALTRHTLRTAAMFTSDPVELLGILNEAILRAETDMRFCTAVCARVEVDDEGTVRLCVASAGHPMPLLATSEGCHEVGGSGMLLGVRPEPRQQAEEVVMEPGERLVMYTDGITEAGAPSVVLESGDLCSMLSDDPGRDARDTLRRIERAALPDEGAEPRDDIAMLVLRRPD